MQVRELQLSLSTTAAHFYKAHSRIVYVSISPLIADEKGKFDELVEQNGVQVLIDSPALMHLFGTRIDFVEDRIR